MWYAVFFHARVAIARPVFLPAVAVGISKPPLQRLCIGLVLLQQPDFFRGEGAEELRRRLPGDVVGRLAPRLLPFSARVIMGSIRDAQPLGPQTVGITCWAPYGVGAEKLAPLRHVPLERFRVLRL